MIDNRFLRAVYLNPPVQVKLCPQVATLFDAMPGETVLGSAKPEVHKVDLTQHFRIAQLGGGTLGGTSAGG